MQVEEGYSSEEQAELQVMAKLSKSSTRSRRARTASGPALAAQDSDSCKEGSDTYIPVDASPLKTTGKPRARSLVSLGSNEPTTLTERILAAVQPGLQRPSKLRKASFEDISSVHQYQVKLEPQQPHQQQAYAATAAWTTWAHQSAPAVVLPEPINTANLGYINDAVIAEDDNLMQLFDSIDPLMFGSSPPVDVSPFNFVPQLQPVAVAAPMAGNAMYDAMHGVFNVSHSSMSLI